MDSNDSNHVFSFSASIPLIPDSMIEKIEDVRPRHTKDDGPKPFVAGDMVQSTGQSRASLTRNKDGLMSEIPMDELIANGNVPIVIYRDEKNAHFFQNRNYVAPEPWWRSFRPYWITLGP